MFEEDDHGQQGFRQDDSGSGDALAMGMDVDIPAATTSGDRREAERRRGREGRYSKSGSCDGLTMLTSLQPTSWAKACTLVQTPQSKPATHSAKTSTYSARSTSIWESVYSFCAQLQDLWLQ